MDKIIGRLFLILFCGALGSWAFLTGPSPVAGQTITTENGVVVVRNPKDPVPIKGVPSTPILKEELVIGAEGGDENFVFSTLHSIQVDDQGHIYALDPKALQIKVFDRAGALKARFGKRGQGPGEWQAPYLMLISPDGRIVVRDALNARFSFYSPEGTLLKEIASQGWMFQRARFDQRGNLFGNSLDYGDKDIIERLTLFDKDLKPVVTVVEFKQKFQPKTVEPFGEATYLDIVKGNSLAWARTGKYEITMADQTGKTVRRILKDSAPGKITEKDRKESLRAIFGENVPADVKIVFPDSFPPLRSFIADDEGRFFVRTYETDDRGRDRYDVFDPEGRYLARFALPSSERLQVARMGKLYCVIRENEAGFPQIKRYSLGWK
jgi:hypothetical protein